MTNNNQPDKPRKNQPNAYYLMLAFGFTIILVMVIGAVLLWTHQQGNSDGYAILVDGEPATPLQTTEETPTPAPTPVPTPSPTPMPTPEPTPVPIYTARLAFVGDLMLHIEQINAARISGNEFDFNYKFRYISPYLQSADFTIGNLETTLVHTPRGYFGWPLFRSPRAFGEAIRDAGFDMVTTGNNHSFDDFVHGVRSTIEILNDIGLAFTGTYLTPECRDEIKMVEINGFTFAFVNYTMHTNAIDLGHYNFMVRIVYHDLVEQATIDYEMIAESLARARALNPDFVVALPHIGIEYYGTMNRLGAGHIVQDNFNYSDTRWYNWMRTLHFMLESGADIVMNHHPHTLLPAEFVYVTNPDGTVRRGFIAYSMANFVSAQYTWPRDTSAIFYLDFKRVGDGPAELVGAAYTPTWVRRIDTNHGNHDFTVFPVHEALYNINAGRTGGFRPSDIDRLRRAQLDVTHMLSGAPIPEEYMQSEYPIFRSRMIEEEPGLPLWGTLPWR